MDLLFSLAHWHALAKLRQHTDFSLVLLESGTVQLGDLLRKFQATTCAMYDTRELKREVGARTRQKAKKSSAKIPVPDNAAGAAGVATADNTFDAAVIDAGSVPMMDKTPTQCSPSDAENLKAKKSSGRQRKTLNLNTYKDHSLGDYVESIRRNGTVDSYSTESVSSVSLRLWFWLLLLSLIDGA